MMVVAFYATLLSKVDTGPIWNARVGLEQQRCIDNWWTNLFYINNYINADRLVSYLGGEGDSFTIANFHSQTLNKSSGETTAVFTWSCRRHSSKIPVAKTSSK